LHWFPPSIEEISVEFGPEWVTCLGAGVSLLWQLNKIGSFDVGCCWFVSPKSDHWMNVACSQGWALLVSTTLLSLRCPKMVGNMVEGEPCWRMGVGKGKGECWAQKHCHPHPWWWCKAHIGVGKTSNGVLWGVISTNAAIPYLPP